MKGTHILAIDLGAESGRAMLATLTDGRVRLRELHRFPNRAHRVREALVWDPFALFAEIREGIARAVRETGGALASVGVDTWGVDFALVSETGELLGSTHHYRDPRTDGVFDRAFRVVPREEIFRATGLQFLQFNTLFQLFAMREGGSTALDAAHRLLMMPDLFNYWLSGEMAQEYTDATTTQCFDPRAGDWAEGLIAAFGLPRRLFGRVARPGTLLGEISGSAADETGAGGVPVALPATHDTGSAVIAAPARGDGWAYVSCGTWALVGVETMRPIVSDEALARNFTNEGGAFGTNRLLCNVMGLWLLQEARREWAGRGEELSYEEIAAAAERAPAFRAWVDPDDPSFFRPTSMTGAIAEFCRRTGQTPPEGIGETARCILESLAAKYRIKIEAAEAIAGTRVETIHMLGGGSRNEALCRATADACGRRVLAGPAEATATGNALVQAAALGELDGLAEVRDAAHRSADPREYAPTRDPRWDELVARIERSAGG